MPCPLPSTSFFNRFLTVIISSFDLVCRPSLIWLQLIRIGI
jgi:hypothetical protein